MEPDWAVKNLQVIRTLMERGALYRRALAPVMSAVGLTGILASVVAIVLNVRAAGGFAAFWMAVALLCLIEAFWLIRRQALQESEAFWSPPTRRVIQALSIPFFAGLAAGAIFLVFSSSPELALWQLPVAWMVLYGGAVHAAGFFMPRGFKLFGWAFVTVGCLAGAGVCRYGPPSISILNGVMGAVFGGAHLAYGVYLHFTEKDGNAA